MLKFIPPLPQIGLNVRMVFSFNKVYGVLVIVPAKMLSWYHKNIDQRQEFRPFADFPRKDLPCPKALVAELDLRKAYQLNNTSCLPDSISLTLKSINLKWFNNVKVCLRILGMLLVNTCTCDQSLCHVEIENLHFQYKDIRKIQWQSTYACSPRNCT